MASNVRMNHPVLSSTDKTRNHFRQVLIFAAGLALTLLILKPGENPVPAPAVPTAPDAVTSATPAASLAGVSVPAPAEGSVERPAPPAPLATTAEMNALVDGPLPLDHKIATLAASMRGTDSRLASEAARRAVFLIGAADYNRLAAPLLLDTTLTPSAMQVLALNSYDRDVQDTLPIMARIANTPGHPIQVEAMETITFHLQDKAAARSEALVQNVEEWLRGQRAVSVSK